MSGTAGVRNGRPVLPLLPTVNRIFYGAPPGHANPILQPGSGAASATSGTEGDSLPVTGLRLLLGHCLLDMGEEQQ